MHSLRAHLTWAGSWRLHCSCSSSEEGLSGKKARASTASGSIAGKLAGLMRTAFTSSHRGSLTWGRSFSGPTSPLHAHMCKLLCNMVESWQQMWPDSDSSCCQETASKCGQDLTAGTDSKCGQNLTAAVAGNCHQMWPRPDSSYDQDLTAAVARS